MGGGQCFVRTPHAFTVRHTHVGTLTVLFITLALVSPRIEATVALSWRRSHKSRGKGEEEAGEGQDEEEGVPLVFPLVFPSVFIWFSSSASFSFL